MESKYYLNDFGLITLIKSLSKAIKEKYYNRTEIDVLLLFLEEKNIKLLLCAEDLLVVLGKVDLKEYSIFFIKAPIEHSSSISSLEYRFEDIAVIKPLYINGIPSQQAINAWAVGDILMIIYLNDAFYALNLSSSSDGIKDIRLSNNKLLYTKDNSTWVNFVNVDSSVISGSPNLITGGAVAARMETLQANINTVSHALDSEILRASMAENSLSNHTKLATTTFLVTPMLESGTYVWEMSGSAPAPDILSNGLTFNIVVPEIKSNILFWSGFHYSLQQDGVNLPVSTLKVGDVLKLRFTGTLYWQGAFEVVNLSNKATRENLANAELRISDVEQLIPEAATLQNPLTDKNFVNSSIATNTATFRGTAPKGLTEALFIEWASALLHDDNDYVFWPTTDSEGNVIYKRYKYATGPGWIFEYDLNNSSFTQEQWETINSGTNSNWKSDVDLLLEQAPTFASKTDVLNLSSALLQEVSRATTSEQLLTDLKANKDEMTITEGSGADLGKTSIQLKSGLQTTVLNEQSLVPIEDAINLVSCVWQGIYVRHRVGDVMFSCLAADFDGDVAISEYLTFKIYAPLWDATVSRGYMLGTLANLMINGDPSYDTSLLYWEEGDVLLITYIPGSTNYFNIVNLSRIAEEETRAKDAEQSLQISISNEVTTREQAIETLDGKISDNTEAITTEKSRAESVEQTLQLAIDTINGKIPAQATSQNQLADKAFVNSSVSTATADFKGTYNSLEDLEQVTANANDYAFVIANDAAGNTLYKRYKWVEGSGWAWEYDLNNSSFTQVQWAAIQSGITAALVTKLSELPDNSTLNQRITQAIATALLNYYTKSEIDAALGNKQDVIQDLAAIRSGASAGATAVQPADMSEAIDEVVQGLENGNIIPAMAETLEPWADQKAIATPDTYTDAVRTTGGDIPIETSAGSKLESIKPVAGSKWTAKLLFNGSYNMLNAAKWGVANSQPFVGGVGSNFVYFLVPELTLGTFGTADENNGLLFTNLSGENVQPISVYYKPLGNSVPQSLTNGTSITPTNVSYDGKSYKTYETSGAGWLVIPKSYYDSDVCAHIAWEDWYDKYVSLNEPTTNPEAVVGVLMLEGLLTLAHANKYLLGVNDEVCDNIVFGETSATITHMVDEIEIATNAWTNSATGESDSQGNVLYRHSAIVSGIKNGGAACIEGNDGGIPLTVNGTTVSYIDTNATAPASVVFYQIPTAVETTKSYSDSVFSGSNINQETGVLPINDCSIEAQVAMEGEAYITVKYAKNIVDQVAINATVDVPQIKKQVEEHEERITELEDTAVRTGSYDATVAVGLADNLKGDTIVDAEFYKRKTGGTQSVGSGIAAIKEVRGKSIVWNSLFRIRNNAAGTYNGVVVTIDNNRVSIVGTNEGANTSVIISLDSKILVPDRKWLFKMFSSGWASQINNVFVQVAGTPSNIYLDGNAAKIIRTTPSNWNGKAYWRIVVPIVSGKTYNFSFTPQIYDLTLMFGSGNEPTVADFEKMFPLDYYDYNAGEVIPFAAQNLVTIGKNQYNPTSGKANLLGGQTYQITGTYTKLYPTVTLINYTYGDTVTAGTYYTNDSNHYVGAKTVNTYDNTKTYALGVYCAYGGSIYKSNVAIETAEEFNTEHWDIIADVAAMITEGILTVWDIVPGVNGVFTLTKDTEVTIVDGNDTDTMIAIYDNENSAYEPYEKHTLPLDPSQWRDKNGELVFPYGGMHGVGTAYDYAKVDADGYIRKAMRVYERRAYESGDVTSGNIITDGRTYTFYPLDEPIEVELATPVYAKYLVDKDGTEEITPANGATPYTTMANISALYAMDARSEIKNLPKNYLSKESAENMLNAMVSEGVIESYTMTYDDTNSRYVFTFVKTGVGIIPVTTSTTSLSAEVSKYYRFDVLVNNLAVTLPSVQDASKVESVVLHFTSGSTPNVTFASSASIRYQYGFVIEANKTYEVNALWNGNSWVIACVEILNV